MTLYAVGAAFVVLMLATERSSRTHKDAAATDELTGLFNRRGVLQAAQELIAQQAQKGEAVSALMFDLDLFKSINDKLGHRIGDEALRLFAATARASTRATDIVGRFGGDEFVACCPGTLPAPRSSPSGSAGHSRSTLSRLRAAISMPPSASGRPLANLARISLRCSLPPMPRYRAKANGRNRVEAAQDGETPILFATGRPLVAGEHAGREGAAMGQRPLEPLAGSPSLR
jgi:GGDEF domain-containing protein